MDVIFTLTNPHNDDWFVGKDWFLGKDWFVGKDSE